MIRLVLMTIAVLLVTAPAMAANSVTDFENYNDGLLEMQWGWGPTSYSPGSLVVSGGSSPMNGNKSIYIDATAGGGEFYSAPFRAGTTFADGTVASMYVRPGTNGWLWFNLLNAGLKPYAGVYFDGTNINYAADGWNWADTGHDHLLNHTYVVSVTLDFTNQNYTLSVQDPANSANNFTVANLAFGSPTTAASAVAGRFYMGGVDTYFDDLSPAVGTPAQAPQTPWFDDFNYNAGLTNAWVNSPPWENVLNLYMAAGSGYLGSVGTWGQGGNSEATLAHMFRVGGGTNAYVVWKEYLSSQDNNGVSDVGLIPVKPAAVGGIGRTGTVVVMDNNNTQRAYSILMLTYATDGSSGEIDTRLVGPNLPNGWWEFKMEALGQSISLYYRQPGTATWNLIGTRTQDEDFAPNFVGIALSTSAFVDDVGFNQEAPAGGNLKGHVTLQGYTPVNATPVAMSVQLFHYGLLFGSQNVVLDSNGDYLIANVPAGSHDVACKVKGFLSKLYSPVVVTGGQDTTQPVTLANGDSDGDNEVTSTDLSIGVANMGQLGN